MITYEDTPPMSSATFHLPPNATLSVTIREYKNSTEEYRVVAINAHGNAFQSVSFFTDLPTVTLKQMFPTATVHDMVWTD